MSDEACYADDIGDYRWEGFPLEQKVAWMQNAQGSAAVQPGVDALRGLSARYAESHRTVQAGLAKLGVTWQGQSAEAAGHAVTQLADWVGGAGQTVSGGGGSMGTYGASFDAMRPRINPPAPIPAVPSVGPKYQPADGAGVLAGLQSAIRQQADATAAADAQANAALRAHQQATRAALSSFPLVNPPPEVVAGAVSTAPASASHGGAPLSPAAVSGPGAGGRGGPTAGGSPAGRGGAAGSAGAGRAGAGAAGAGAAGAGPGSGAAGAGSAAAGAGQHGGTATGGGTTTAGAGAPAPPVDAGGWTPLSAAPTGGGLMNGPNGGVVNGPNGGLVPASISSPYPGIPGSGGQTGAGRSAGAGGAGPRGGYTEAYRAPPLAPRTGGGAVHPQFGGDFGVPRNAPGRSASPMGAAPMGLGGGSRAGEERAHRNQTFIPSDELFRVEFCDVTPPVLGVRDEEAW